MKKILLILLAFIPYISFCQHLPIELNVQSFKTGNHIYTLHIEVLIEDGWHAFAFPDKASGIQPFKLLLENQNILFPNNPEDGGDCNTVLLKDSLFSGRSFLVYTKHIFIDKTVEVSARIPFLTLTLTGFVSNNKTIVPIGIAREVKIVETYKQAIILKRPSRSDEIAKPDELSGIPEDDRSFGESEDYQFRG